MTPTPSPKQMQDAHKLSVMVYGEGLSGIEKRTAIFLAARDAAKDREIAELREEVRAFPGQIINITKTYESAFSSIKERAEKAESALATRTKERDEARSLRDKILKDWETDRAIADKKRMDWLVREATTILSPRMRREKRGCRHDMELQLSPWYLEWKSGSIPTAAWEEGNDLRLMIDAAIRAAAKGRGKP